MRKRNPLGPSMRASSSRSQSRFRRSTPTPPPAASRQPPAMSDVGKKLALLDVDKFVKFGGSTFRADKFYKTIGYGLGSVGHLLSLRAGRDSDVSSGFKAISSHIGMARFVLRFTGGFEAYEALKNGSWCYGDDDAHLRRVVSLQAVSMLVYYPMEHLSYVGFVAPKVLNIDANRISRQSCMAWTIYVILDIYANFLRIRNIYRKEREIREQKDLTDEAREVLITGFQKRRKELFYQQLRNACFFPTCFHWSLENGLIPESSVQFLCFIEAVIGFWRTWVNLG